MSLGPVRGWGRRFIEALEPPFQLSGLQWSAFVRILHSVAKISRNIPKIGRIATAMRDTLTFLCASALRSRSVCSSATVSTGQHRYIYRRSAIQSAQMYIDRDFALLTTATWSCRTPALTDSVGAVFLCPDRTSGTSCHLTFGKCPINQNNLLEHWKLFLFPNSTDKHF